MKIHMLRIKDVEKSVEKVRKYSHNMMHLYKSTVKLSLDSSSIFGDYSLTLILSSSTIVSIKHRGFLLFNNIHGSVGYL